MTTTYRKKLIEVALPLEKINEASVREGFIYKGNPSAIHKWWAQRPLAAARAVLFGQLVDDPSSWPERFKSEVAQDAERKRLFKVIEDLVQWENSNNEAVINTARLEIAQSHARSSDSPKAKSILRSTPSADAVNDYLASELPPVYDPFAGGGTIPLEAQRLGLRAIASDLNPVAVMINKALIEIPPKFANRPPVNPEARKKAGMNTWKGAQGLADDVRYYGKWMRDGAFKRIGHLYPEVELPKQHGGGKAPVIAWLWARTVASPDPAFRGVHVPLVTNFFLSTKEGKQAWIEPIIEGNGYRFEIRTGKPKDKEVIASGTKLGRGANFRCIMSKAPIEPDYIKAEGMAGRLGTRLMAVVGEGKRTRVYVAANEEMERLAKAMEPSWIPDEHLPNDPRNFWTVNYGLNRYSDLFTKRQLAALSTFAEHLSETRGRVISDASGLGNDATPLHEGGTGPQAYGDAVCAYLAMSISKMLDYHCALVAWYAGEQRTSHLFTRQAIPMVWDFVENNPFAEVGGGFSKSCKIVAEVIDHLPQLPGLQSGVVFENDARQHNAALPSAVVSTDPPYFDNISYADLSDHFYIWLRKMLREHFPDVFGTLLVPKAGELVASPYRHGGDKLAEQFFVEGITQALRHLHVQMADSYPLAVYYAFKQAETESVEGVASTGWETFLQGLCDAGFQIDGTWPVRTERAARAIGIGTNALASSIVLSCRKRPEGQAVSSRADFRRELRAKIGSALVSFQHSHIAPVDVAQASIGPGMAIFSRYSKVLEADGSAMSVRSALQLINEALDEYLNHQEGEVDSDTRFAITWFEANQFAAGAYGDAETLAKARNVSVSGVDKAGIIHSAAGKVRLLKRSELPEDWDPTKDAEH